MLYVPFYQMFYGEPKQLVLFQDLSLACLFQFSMNIYIYDCACIYC